MSLGASGGAGGGWKVAVRRAGSDQDGARGVGTHLGQDGGHADDVAVAVGGAGGQQRRARVQADDDVARLDGGYLGRGGD